jgi:hypothetical protein
MKTSKERRKLKWKKVKDFFKRKKIKKTWRESPSGVIEKVKYKYRKDGKTLKKRVVRSVEDRIVTRYDKSGKPVPRAARGRTKEETPKKKDTKKKDK